MKKVNSATSQSTNPSEIKIYQPSEIQTTFDKLIGLENAKDDLKDVIEYIKDPTTFNTLKIKPHIHYLINGPDGVGKSSLAMATASAANIPIIVADCNGLLIARRKAFKLLRSAFKTASSYEYAVLHLKDFEKFFKVNDSFKNALLSELSEFLKKHQNVIVLATHTSPLYFSNCEFLFDEETFSKRMEILLPDLKTREEMYKIFCENVPVDENVSFSRLSIDSYGMTAKEIKLIIKNATLLSLRNHSKTVTREHFDEIISLKLLGQKRKKMTENERRATAYHEAGHVIAGFFSDPNYKLSKVEIIHRSNTLGVTIEENDEDKLTLFKKDYEYRIISYLGGIVAERIIFSENSSGVSQDLAMATYCAKQMITNFGMCDEFGIYSVYDTSYDEEAVGTISEELINEINKHIKTILKDMYDRAFDIVTKHRKELEALTEALLQKEVVYGNEIREIFKKCEND